VLFVVNCSNTLDVRVQDWGQPAREARNAQQVVLQDEYPAGGGVSKNGSSSRRRVGSRNGRGERRRPRDYASADDRHLTEPTLIGSTIVQGPALFTRDNAKMARGEPCTTVYLFEPTKGPDEEISSFHCIPTARKVVHKEGHGVPTAPEFTFRTIRQKRSKT
jgi:hypothetical protein